MPTNEQDLGPFHYDGPLYRYALAVDLDGRYKHHQRFLHPCAAHLGHLAPTYEGRAEVGYLGYFLHRPDVSSSIAPRVLMRSARGTMEVSTWDCVELADALTAPSSLPSAAWHTQSMPSGRRTRLGCLQKWRYGRESPSYSSTLVSSQICLR